MSDDPKTLELIAHLSTLIDKDEQRLLPLKRTVAQLKRGVTELPWDRRYVNLPLQDAYLRFLTEFELDGATWKQIAEALEHGGAHDNRPNFDRDLENSLQRSVRSGILLKEGGKYIAGKKRPAHAVNRNKKKPKS